MAIASDLTFVLFDAQASTATSDDLVLPGRDYQALNRKDPGAGASISFDIVVTGTASVQILGKVHPDSANQSLGTATGSSVTRVVTAPLYSVAAQVVSISSGTVTVRGKIG